MRSDEHNRVNTSFNFVDPETQLIHTQNIENMWDHAKKKLRNQYETSERLISGYLIEFYYRKKISLY